MEKEIRVFNAEGAEVRSTGGRQVAGFGIVFNSQSELMGNFREVILPQAIDGVLENSDVLALLNHDESRGILARSDKGKGTLTLKPESRGLKYAFEAPKTSLGDELLEGLRRGDIKSSSFAFSVAQNGEKWEKQQDGTYLRTISKFDRIFDVSPCFRPAYSDTTVALRSLESFASSTSQPTEAQLRAEHDALKAGRKPQKPATKYVLTTPKAKEPAQPDVFLDIVTRGKMDKPPRRVKTKQKPAHIPEDEQKLREAWDNYKAEHPDK